MAEYYIDPSAGVDGDGSAATPWNTFSHLGSLSGNLLGASIYVRRGTTAFVQLYLQGASNFRILPYGSGDLPIIDGSVAIADGSWTLDGGLNAYYISAAAPHAVFVDGLRMTRVGSSGGLSGDNTQWFDGGNSRLYVHLAGNASPVGKVSRRTNLNYCVQLIDCTDWTLDSIEVRKADDTGVIAYCISGDNHRGTIQDCVARDCGGYGFVAGDSFLVWGRSAAAMSTGLKLLRNRSYSPINAAYELNWIDGILVEGNISQDAGTGLELYRACKNVTIRRHRSERAVQRVGFGTGKEIWLAHSGVDPGKTGGHVNCRVEASIFANSQFQAIDVQAGISHVIANNSFYQCGGSTASIRAHKDGADDVGVTVANNIVHTGGISPYLLDIGPALGGALVMDHNLYWSDILVQFNLGTTYCPSLGAFQQASGQEAHSAAGDPLFTNAGAGDLTIPVRSPAVGTGSTLHAASSDFVGAPYGTPPNCGAYAKAIGSWSSVASDSTTWRSQ